MFVDRSYKMHVHESWPSKSYTYWSSFLLSVAQLHEAFFQLTWTQPLALLHPYLLSNPSLISASSFYFLSLLLSAILTLKSQNPFSLVCVFYPLIHHLLSNPSSFTCISPSSCSLLSPCSTLSLVLPRLYFLHFLLSLLSHRPWLCPFENKMRWWSGGLQRGSAAVRQVLPQVETTATFG